MEHFSSYKNDDIFHIIDNIEVLNGSRLNTRSLNILMSILEI